ncbi:unnamed protein product [Moneuplotes crassus]|uniref:Uncharacterized protein n=1 Tax=Euplotes crassus TaxID=5936 RepID=A0AAD2D089_EUPCR|nr:unnamed protein product [Moneuplotes crassus]
MHTSFRDDGSVIWIPFGRFWGLRGRKEGLKRGWRRGRDCGKKTDLVGVGSLGFESFEFYYFGGRMVIVV